MTIATDWSVRFFALDREFYLVALFQYRLYVYPEGAQLHLARISCFCVLRWMRRKQRERRKHAPLHSAAELNPVGLVHRVCVCVCVRVCVSVCVCESTCIYRTIRSVGATKIPVHVQGTRMTHHVDRSSLCRSRGRLKKGMCTLCIIFSFCDIWKSRNEQ